MKVEDRISDGYLLYVSFLEKLLEDALSDKGVNQESGRHTMQGTGYYTGEKHGHAQDEPAQLA